MKMTIKEIIKRLRYRFVYGIPYIEDKPMTLEQSVYSAFVDLSPYMQWYCHQTFSDACWEIASRTCSLLTLILNTKGRIKRTQIMYAGVKAGGIEVWAWQMDKDIAADCAYPTPKLHVLVNQEGFTITRFLGKDMSENEWWKQEVIENASWVDVDLAVKWISTHRSKYQIEQGI